MYSTAPANWTKIILYVYIYIYIYIYIWLDRTDTAYLIFDPFKSLFKRENVAYIYIYIYIYTHTYMLYHCYWALSIYKYLKVYISIYIYFFFYIMFYKYFYFLIFNCMITSIQTSMWICASVLSIRAIIIGNRISKQIQFLHKDVCISLHINSLGKAGIHLFSFQL